MSAWTDAEKRELSGYLRAGMSAGQIAKLMPDRGRNAIIGVVHRDRDLGAIGLKGGQGQPASVSISENRRKNVRGGKPKKIIRFQAKANDDASAVGRHDARAEAKAKAPSGVELVSRVVGGRTPTATSENGRDGVERHAPISRMVALLDLKASECRWPCGDPKEEGFGFCGHDAPGLVAYCAYHASLAYVPLPIRRKAAA